MKKQKHKGRRQNSPLEAWVYQTALSLAERGSNRAQFPLPTLCAGILIQIEHDYRNAASASNRHKIAEIRNEILFPGGVVANILECCDCDPENYLAKLEAKYPLGCPHYRNRKKEYLGREF